jgi:flagellar motor switch protein FliG
MSTTTFHSARLSPLQKAAVLINSLDMRSADALLDQMPETQAARVRQAMLDLDDVPAAEQEQVISEFLTNGGRLPQLTMTPNDTGVELELSDVAPPPPLGDSAERGNRSCPFDFLKLASPALLADFLRAEHPQTVAVVLANVDPNYAARVLERLPSELSTESLARMARLYQLTDDVLADLADGIRHQLMPRIEAERRPQGLAGASAVLSALHDDQRKRLLSTLARHDQSLVRQLGYLDNAAAPARPQTKLAPQQPASTMEPPISPTNKPALSFAQLSTADDSVLKRVFAAAEPQTLLLALTGADDRLVQRVLRQLPSAEASSLRQRLNHPGPVRLRDIDFAQHQLASLAQQLHERGEILLPFLPSPPAHLSLQS